jgi:predicted DCC family thiol-disulfide oxidoreductase YuxK
MKIDQKALFYFAPLTGKTTKKIEQQTHRCFKTENSLVLIENYSAINQKIYLRSKGVFRIFWILGGKWKLLGILSFLPFLFDLVYTFIASHRQSIGQRKIIFSKAQQSRILQ